jgi:hypothetical protein
MSTIKSNDPALLIIVSEYVEPEVNGYKESLSKWFANVGIPNIEDEKIKLSSPELTINQIFADINKHIISMYPVEILNIILSKKQA